MRFARLVPVALVLLLTVPAGARAASGDALLRRMATPWPALQRADGTFPDAVVAQTGAAGRDPYGTAMMGYGLLAAGVRLHDGRMVGAGLRALGQAASNPAPSHLIFEGLALAGGYTLAERSAAHDPRFAAVRPGWEARLRAIQVLQIGRHPYSNWNAVEALELLELARSGLRPDAAALRRTARGVFDTAVPRTLAPGGILSDPPWEPLAYHAFTTALLARARAVAGVGSAATLARAAAGTAALMSPSGDVSYLGRSDNEAWTLTMTASAMRAAGRPDLAARALGRLRAHYLGGPRGFRLSPSGSVPALDTYAASVPYSGLALVGLAWADATRVTAGRRAPAPRSALLGGGNGRFAVVRTPDVWFAVKEQPGRAVPGRPQYAGDLRYDAGLAALERRTATGWHAVLPARPRTTRLTGAESLTLTRRGRRGRLAGTRLVLSGHGRAVTLAGVWRTALGASAGAARVIYSATRCGVAVRIATRPGDRVRLVVRSGDRSVRPATVPGARVTVGRAEASSSDGHVVPFTYAVTAHAGHVSATVCPHAAHSARRVVAAPAAAAAPISRAVAAPVRRPRAWNSAREHGARDDARLARAGNGAGCERARDDGVRPGMMVAGLDGQSSGN